jgi:DNA-binding PadR family transcriptional regulator
MTVKISSSPFGSQARTRALLGLQLLVESYSRELARVFEMNLSSVQKALRSLERDGLIVGRAVGRTRVFRLNPRILGRRELERYLDRLLESDTDLRRRAATLRRRPRRSGKPL